MLVTKEYNREHAVEYALRWALERNPVFSVYDGLGGDCTNFVSQSLLAGSCEMNYTPIFGWYYRSPSDRTASWTGVQFFYNFITSNEGTGPFGEVTDAGNLGLGDVIQLGNREGVWYHTLIVTGFGDETYLVSAHSNDAQNRPLNTYVYDRARFIRINGVRIEVEERTDCFDYLINGEIPPDIT